jgi:hypothetical protein
MHTLFFWREYYMHTSSKLAATHVMTCMTASFFFYWWVQAEQENERKIEKKKSAMLQLRSKRTPRHRVPHRPYPKLPLRKWLLQKFEPTTQREVDGDMSSCTAYVVLPSLIPVRRFRTKPAGRWWSGYTRIHPFPLRRFSLSLSIYI